MHRRMKNPFNPKSQNYRILERLREGPATNMDETGAYFIPESVRDFELRRVNGEPSADVPHKLVYHSPTGFEWGYGGSGPADLALNILASFLPLRQAWALHQPFKWRFIATMPREGGTIKGDDIRQFLKENAPCTGE